MRPHLAPLKGHNNNQAQYQWNRKRCYCSHHILVFRTFELFALGFGLPLLDIGHESRGGMWWQGVFWRGQRRTPAAFNTVSQRWWQRRAAREFCLTPGSIPSLSWIIFLSIPRIANRHWEGEALLDGPPPPGRFLLLLLLLFFSFLWGQS